MKKTFIEVQPGEVFESWRGSFDGHTITYVKLSEQKVANIANWDTFKWHPFDLQAVVKVIGKLELVRS